MLSGPSACVASGSGCGNAGAGTGSRVDGGKDTLGSVENSIYYINEDYYSLMKNLYLLVLSGSSTGVASGSGCGNAGAGAGTGESGDEGASVM